MNWREMLPECCPRPLLTCWHCCNASSDSSSVTLSLSLFLTLLLFFSVALLSLLLALRPGFHCCSYSVFIVAFCVSVLLYVLVLVLVFVCVCVCVCSPKKQRQLVLLLVLYFDDFLFECAIVTRQWQQRRRQQTWVAVHKRYIKWK